MIRKSQATLMPEDNHLLAALSAEVRQRIYPHLEPLPLPLGKALCEAGDLLTHVYFPIDAIVSLLYVLENGAPAEIAVIGNEGMVGVELLMSGESMPGRIFVQSAGSCYRLSSQRIRDEFNRHGEMLALALRFTQALLTQIAQTAVCNRHHTIDQRLCRWLLLLLDRVPDNKLNLTQERIASMLGVRRRGVSAAAGRLQDLAVIRYHRGHITVLNRRKLEKLSCECYGVVRKQTDRLLASAHPATLYTGAAC